MHDSDLVVQLAGIQTSDYGYDSGLAKVGF